MNKKVLKEVAYWVGIVIQVVMAVFLVLGAPVVIPGQSGIGSQAISETRFRSVEVQHDLDVDGTADLDDLDIDLSGELEIDGGLTDFGGCTAGVADGDNDVCIAAVLEVDGELEADGAIDADAGVAISGGSLNLDDALDQDGSSDEVQLSVTGYTTQTNDLVQFGGGLTDIGGGTYTVADGDNDLGVAGDVEVEGNVVLSSANYPLEYASASRIVYFGVTSAFTGTTTILAATTGIANVQMILCQVDDPDDDAGDAFACVGSESSGDVTLTAVDTAGDTSSEVDTTAYYIIIGY